FLHGVSVLLEHRGVVPACRGAASRRQRGDPARVQRLDLRPRGIRLSFQDADAEGPDGGARVCVGCDDWGDDLVAAGGIEGAPRRVVVLSRLLRRSFARARRAAPRRMGVATRTAEPTEMKNPSVISVTSVVMFAC